MVKNAKPVRRAKMSWKKIPTQGVLLIQGHRGEGKSALGWWLAQEMQKRTKKSIVTLGMPVAAQKVFPKRGFGKGGLQFVSSLDQIDKMKPSIVICDEAAFIAGSRDAMSKTNKEWLKLIAICRHKDHLLIFINQQSRQLDVQIMMDADLVLMKRPTQLHLRGARAEFAPEIAEAFELFSNMRGSTKRKVYVVDYHYGGGTMLNAQMPRWWNDKVSKAYSSVDVVS
jgi:predicted double-glycine peptidase|tara:strand:- start:2649 stop:3326 length:678 start_codon:yes stop_codon:yes gene_type:complete